MQSSPPSDFRRSHVKGIAKGSVRKHNKGGCKRLFAFVHVCSHLLAFACVFASAFACICLHHIAETLPSLGGKSLIYPEILTKKKQKVNMSASRRGGGATKRGVSKCEQSAGNVKGKPDILSNYKGRG